MKKKVIKRYQFQRKKKQEFHSSVGKTEHLSFIIFFVLTLLDRFFYNFKWTWSYV